MTPETVQTIALIVIGLGGLGLLIGLVWVGLRENKGDPLQNRLAEFVEREMPKSLEEVELSMGFRERVLLPLFKGLADRLSRLRPKARSKPPAAKSSWRGKLTRWTRAPSSARASC